MVWQGSSSDGQTNEGLNMRMLKRTVYDEETLLGPNGGRRSESCRRWNQLLF